ncbi:hypothetical protein [Silvanigrella sp.]|jgi:hypothetical protein|uniref:hypothetical protein n=1 Tax=Silvanigrella sp. TaxID=2024976 RepID=UPI0037CBA3F4
MNHIIKDFEKILYNSLVYYPDKNMNVASTFKVILPEIYYEKFRELNENQKLIITEFVNIFLDKLQKSEQIDNKELREGFLEFKYQSDILLNKQNIMNYVIEFFGDTIDPYHDVKMLSNAQCQIKVENNQIGSSNFNNFMGKHILLNNCGCHVVVKLNSKYQDKVVEYMKQNKLALFYFKTKKEMTLYFTLTFFEGKAVYFKNSFDTEIEEFNSL